MQHGQYLKLLNTGEPEAGHMPNVSGLKRQEPFRLLFSLTRQYHATSLLSRKWVNVTVCLGKHFQRTDMKQKNAFTFTILLSSYIVVHHQSGVGADGMETMV